jgi:penicillin amidase
MRMLAFILSLAVTAGLVFVLDSRTLLPAPLGKLLSPQEGIWQNAEPSDMSHAGEFRFAGLEGRTDVYIDDRLVPHIFAEKETDAYFVQGFIHARFRLWQMEFQTHAAAGRISEIIGPKAISYDQHQRRMGMVYGAENALKAMEADADTKASMDAYTAGVNAYISGLSSAELPVEYKLLGYEPEQWTNLKTALFIKALTNDLAGYDRDFELMEVLRALGEKKFRMLFPDVPDSLSPIIPPGTVFTRNDAPDAMPVSADSVYLHRQDSAWFEQPYKPDPANGSNNWVLSGTRTQSGKPILCNDPHLRLSLPAIWFEMQLHTPAFNAYGVSFPGIPGIVIGFNDHIAFGFTNSGRDVRDYYEIRFRDSTRKEYAFNGGWRSSTLREERIRVKDSTDILDTVAYTLHGPVIYDARKSQSTQPGKSYALRWVAHDESNPLRMWYLLNRAKTYDDYLAAIRFFNVPGQNIIFASKSGDIALWQQANFPLRWKDQGLFPMPGDDSSYLWKGFIPQADNPHVLNPVQGYIGSANQRPVDSTYPYFIPGSYDVYRGIILNRRLAELDNASVDDMKALQNDNYNVFAEYARPILLKYVRESALDPKEREFLGLVRNWNLNHNPDEKAPAVFVNWWDSLQAVVFADELFDRDKPLIKPDRFVLLEALLRDSAWQFVDDARTSETERIEDMVTLALQKASPVLKAREQEGKLAWGSYKNTSIYHLLRNNALPFARQGVINGGGTHILNATTHDHGPSWRMIIHLDSDTEAWVVYPGGQSGNPGSRYYDSFVDTWAKGSYYRAWVMKDAESSDSRVQWRMTFKP